VYWHILNIRMPKPSKTIHQTRKNEQTKTRKRSWKWISSAPFHAEKEFQFCISIRFSPPLRAPSSYPIPGFRQPPCKHTSHTPKQFHAPPLVANDRANNLPTWGKGWTGGARCTVCWQRWNQMAQTTALANITIPQLCTTASPNQSWSSRHRPRPHEAPDIHPNYGQIPVSLQMHRPSSV